MKHLHPQSALTIMAGALVIGFGINAFNLANGLAEGGVTGLAILLRMTLGIEPWMTTLAFNVPLLVLGWRVLGRDAMISTVFGALALSGALWLFRQVRVPVDDPLLAALYAGASVGFGLGLVFRAGGTTGGVDIVARIAHLRWGIKSGRTILAADVVILALSLVHLEIRQVMYTIVAVFVGTRVLDLVLDAATASRTVMIVSRRSEEILRRVTSELGRGVTVLHGTGGYTGEARDVLLVVVRAGEAHRLERIVLECDADAFVTMSESGRVLGEGFSFQSH